jgi:hypothetical protein
MACVSKTELKEILKNKLPTDVLCYLIEYHAHPIIEYIGLDNLKKQYDNLSIAPRYVYWSKCRNDKSTLKRSYEKLCYYYAQRRDNVNWSNYLMTADYTIDTIFYPFNSHTLKDEILSYAKRNGIQLKKSWTKRKMLDEFYKKIEM